MRITRRDLIFAGLAVAYSWPGTKFVVAFVTESQSGLTIAPVLGIIASYLTLSLIDCVLWKPHGKDQQDFKQALRQAELTLKIALGEPSPKRSPRKWWRGMHSWWLKRKYQE